MRAVCLVGGCRVLIAESDSGTVLEQKAEEHRRLFHEWVKPGRVHTVEEDSDDLEVAARELGLELKTLRRERWRRGAA